MPKTLSFSFQQLVKWPRFPVDADKYARGVVGVMTGSGRSPGAAVLSVLGALNAGAGFVRYCGTPAATPALLVRAPSVTVGPGRVGAWVAGCGWDEAETQANQERWQQVTSSGVPVVVDAGALPLALDGVPAGSLLTPHAGELARLLGVPRADVAAAPHECALEAARRCGAVVLLKGHRQFVAVPAGPVTEIQAGSPWLARAGSGDVLAGVAGTLLAQTGDPETAGLLAAGLQAWVSTQTVGPYPPDRLAECLPEFVGRL
ncbi:MAG: NAD(P)H-hydrate dehydratase [Propionibacteriaceae bacterium]|jgi:hydroxyethylthiazole kinase-like uncharacterized protein yjeF|nr:NAD(P)H-hydrate dehydratase [Propionibacteriaceae bacterium]